MKNLSYSLSLGALGAAAVPASGAIVYSGMINQTITGAAETQTIYFNLQTQQVSTSDFAGSDFSLQVSPAAPEIQFSVANWSTVTNFNAYAKNAPRYTTADSSEDVATWDNTFSMLRNTAATGESDWEDNGAGYLALRIRDTNSDPFIYGWAQLQMDTNTTSITLIDFAYESDPNTHIQMGAVPEPAHAAGILALGALGIAAYRRRKQA